MRTVPGFLAKTARPRLPPVVPRPRLFHLLDRGCTRPLVWITGPPGAGKTTFVASYVEARRLGSLWYQVDEGDGDVATFFHYLALAAKPRGGRASAPLPPLTPEYQAGLSTFARRYFQALYARLRQPFVIVLDNYQEAAADSPLHQVIGEAAGACPPGGNLIVISRSAPPSALARLRGREAMALIGWDQLKLTLAESRRLLRLRGHRLSRDAIDRFHGRAAGWAAGLVLLFEENRASRSTSRRALPLASDTAFEYFAGEIFQHADPETQRLLLRTAFLTQITPRMAEALAGVRRADRILTDLHRRSYFTERRAGPEAVYQFHPLFREFLLTRARDTLSQDEQVDVQRTAASLLAEAGRVEDAVTLLRDARDWHAIVRIALTEALSLVAQGRSQTLEQWLADLPAAVTGADGWLQYWLGVCRLPARPAESRRCFERAFDLMAAARDPVGTYLAWCGAVDATLYAWADFTPLDRWIDRLPDLRRVHPTWPSVEIEARVAASMFGALMFRRPQHPEIREWAERAFSLADSVPQRHHRLLVGFHLTLYRLWLGDLAGAAAVVEALREAGRSRDATPMARLMWSVAEAAYDWHVAATDGCLAIVSDALEVGRRAGLHVWDYNLLAQGVYGSMTRGDLRGARGFLDRMVAVLDDARHLDRSHYHFLGAWEAALRGDRPRALGHARTAVDLTHALGTPFPEALTRLALAQVLCDRGELDEAEAELARGRETGRQIGSRMLNYMSRLVEARLALDRGDAVRAVAALHAGLAVGRAQGYVNTPWWRPDAMARLAVLALRAGVEVEYLRDLVRRRGLQPESPPVDLEAWPWPVMVYTLGEFRLIRDGDSGRFTGKVRQRPLSMLKALVAFGERGVTEAQLSDALWPDAESDAAHQALATTLHRLRGLVGHETVVLRGGRLALDPRRCWVDAWAFEHLTDRAEAAETRGPLGQGRDLAEQAMRLYRGPFLAGDAGESWAIAPRERLRRRFLRWIERAGRLKEQASQWREAADWYEKGLEVDDLAEELYQRLMVCHQRLERPAEGLAVYERCRAALTAGLGVAPSPGTEALRQTLRSATLPART